ncbi:MAG: DUF2520 domain-containing protein [Flavobacteriales bacterium]|nr:DUF2520 domain-containing protein [Flavobacteriales bacterium]
MKSIKTISFIGSGNVATQLATALFSKQFLIHQIYSKSIENATVLAEKVNADATSNISELNNKADIYIVSVTDDAIEQVLQQFTHKEKLIVHTSGTVEMDIFKTNGFVAYGIFYPLQTLSKTSPVDFTTIPFCIEAVSPTVFETLNQTAAQLSNRVYSINSIQRKHLHVAAVFACNFTNEMYQIASKICADNNLDFDILKPLILETANKILIKSPKEAQTGPAKRKDFKTIEKHIKLLENDIKTQELYTLITQHIINSTQN